MTHEKRSDAKGTWITYRPEIKVLDCTLRDGGLINNHHFENDFAKTVYETCLEAGVDYMEFGYKASKKIFSPTEYGPWKFCTEEDIRRIVDENPSNLKISVMADAERTDYHVDILPREDSVIDMIRVATYIHQIPTAMDMLKDAHDKGYETTVNLMAVSIVQERELLEALDLFAQSPVNVVYVVDSFGSFYSEQLRDLTLCYLDKVKELGKEVGIHAHNNQQLAYANTIEGLIVGANYLDATINGMGRGAGNCPLELLLGFLKNPKFKTRPVLKAIQETFVPLQSEMEWGFRIPYMITGQFNRHPRPAIKMRAGDNPDDYVSFYDQMSEEE